MSARIVYSCPFVPAEWIAAHGLQPCRITPRSSDALPELPEPGVCPYARAFAGAAISDESAAAVVVTTACDQMRRACDLIRASSQCQVFQMNIPHTWQQPGAYKLYVSELQRLGRFMVRLGGETPSNEALAQKMLEYDEARGALKGACSRVSSRAYAELIARFNRTGELRLPEGDELSVPSGVPLALVGGPMLADHFDVYDAIEQAGGYVVLDATENGERTLPAPLDRRALRGDPLLALADAYFGSIPDPFRRPNSELYRWLKELLPERGVRGIVLRRYVWCDTWNAEAHRMREWSQMPLFHLDVGDDVLDSARTASRLQAFVETLR